MTKIIQQGAEAVIILDKNKIIKHRIKKSYRIPELDKKIRERRTRSEAKLLQKAGKIINIPKIIGVNEIAKSLYIGFIKGKKLSEYLDNFPLKKQKQICRQIGKDIAKLHNSNIIHGDLTTSNMILIENKNKLDNVKSVNKKRGDNEKVVVGEVVDKSKPVIFFIDFGLGFISHKFEDKAVDIHLLKQALEAKHFKNWKILYKEFEKGYKSINKIKANKTLNQLNKVEKRGRYKD